MRCGEPSDAATRPQAARAANAMMSWFSWMRRLRYGLVRKKSMLRADTSAVATPALRPPNAATSTVRTTKANERFDAVVDSRNGISATPSRMARSGPAPM